MYWLKEAVENKIVAFAEEQYSFNFNIVSYDVKVVADATMISSENIRELT
jgi:hypothetical protein